MKFDGERTLEFRSTNSDDIGQILIAFTASLMDYPAVASSETVLLFVEIKECVVESLSFEQVEPQVYTLFSTSPDQPLVFSFAEFS